MSHSLSRFTIVRQCITALAVMIVASPGFVQAGSPQIGDVQTLPVITLSLRVSSTGKETKQATYTPPPGWQIRNHYVICTKRYGNSSYAISTVPAGWNWTSQVRIDESHQQLFEAAAKIYKVPLQTILKLRWNDAVHELANTNANASHPALVLDATATGEGLFRSGSGIHLTVVAELVYVGTPSTGREVTSHNPDVPK